MNDIKCIPIYFLLKKCVLVCVKTFFIHHVLIKTLAKTINILIDKNKSPVQSVMDYFRDIELENETIVIEHLCIHTVHT